MSDLSTAIQYKRNSIISGPMIYVQHTDLEGLKFRFFFPTPAVKWCWTLKLCGDGLWRPTYVCWPSARYHWTSKVRVSLSLCFNWKETAWLRFAMKWRTVVLHATICGLANTAGNLTVTCEIQQLQCSTIDRQTMVCWNEYGWIEDTVCI